MLRVGFQASRASPWSYLVEDSRGRTRALAESIIGLKVGSAGLLAADSTTYGDGGFTSVLFLGKQICIPTRAAFVPLSAALSLSTLASFLTPPPRRSVGPRSPSFFAPSIKVWRIAARHMWRASLGTEVEGDPGFVAAAGAFAVANSAAKSRFIGDRSPENFDVGAFYDVALPYGPGLRRLRIRPGFSARGNFRDASDFYFILRVPEEWLQKQLIGPRLPRSWFAQLDEKFNDAEPEGDWWWDDLYLFGSNRSAVGCSATHLNFALPAIMMGDTNGVLVAEDIHRNALFSGGAIGTDTLLVSGGPFPLVEVGNVLADVCVDELLVIGFVPAGDSCAPGRDTLLTARADAVYEAWDIERSAARAVDHALHFEGWGVDVKGDAGFAGVRFSKRCVQAELGLYGCVYGCRSLYWRRLLGLWNFSFALHPPLLSIFGRLLPKGQLLDELIGWSLANLIAEADLRAGISYVV
jgi:hypothetical protein